MGAGDDAVGGESPDARVVVFGGTFDPPHLGHLIAAADAADALEVDRVLFVPAGIPPHKRDQEITPSPIRLEMVRAATAEEPRFSASEIETGRAGPSYMVDTLRLLAGELPTARLFLLVGEDQFESFGEWRRPEEIRRLATLAVMSRRGEPPEGEGASLPGDAVPVPVTRVDISSTLIRSRVAAGRSIRYLVPGGVERIIRREGLYRDRRSTPV